MGGNVMIDIREVSCGGMDWIDLALDGGMWQALVNAGMNFQVSYNPGNFLTSCKPVSFSRRTLLLGVRKLVYSYE
jgi:hypothetical protein